MTEIIAKSPSAPDVLALFTQHDDFMIHFLGADSKYYTPYSEHENLANVWVARVDGAPAGCVAFREKAEGTGEVKRLFVREEYRGRGLSKALLETVERHAREHGFARLFLDTRSTLEPAVSIYRSFGFQVTFRQGLYIQMERSIT